MQRVKQCLSHSSSLAFFECYQATSDTPFAKVRVFSCFRSAVYLLHGGVLFDSVSSRCANIQKVHTYNVLGSNGACMDAPHVVHIVRSSGEPYSAQVGRSLFLSVFHSSQALHVCSLQIGRNLSITQGLFDAQITNTSVKFWITLLAIGPMCAALTPPHVQVLVKGPRVD